MDNLLFTALFGLLFSNYLVVTLTSTMGHVFTRHPAFSRALMFALFTMIYNVYLKSLWQYPLPEPLTGWALPSGHMHVMLIFWGWLAIESRKWIIGFIVAFLAILHAYGLLYQGYHYPIDIVAAWGFAGSSLLVLWLLHRSFAWIRERPDLFGLLLSFICLILIAVMPEQAKNFRHVWQAHGALIGWIMGLMMCYRIPVTSFKDAFNEKLTSFMILLALLSVLFTLTQAPQGVVTAKSYDFIRCYILTFMAASWPMWFAGLKKLIRRK